MTNFLLKTFLKDPLNRTACGNLAGVVGIICNLVLASLKIAAGFIFASIAIIADGVNNFTDATSSIVTLVGFKLASRPPDKGHPFGHARFEYLSGLVISFIIMILGFNLATSSFKKILNPEELEFSWLVVIILIFSILLKLWMGFFNRKLSVLIDSATLKATATDSFNDVITTSAVLIALLISEFFAINLDGFIGVGVSLFILYSGTKLVKETLSPLLGEAPDKDLVNDTIDTLLSHDGVLGIHDLMVHDYGPNRRFASVHVEMDARKDFLECHDIVDIIERKFLEKGLHLVVHLDPIIVDDPAVDKLKAMTIDIVHSIDPTISVHDFRAVIGYSHTNLIFDVAVSPDFKTDPNQLKAELVTKIKAQDKNLFPVINVEQHYISL